MTITGEPGITIRVPLSLAELGRSIHTSHFIRQTIITRRREADWINRCWCKNQQLTPKSLTLPWTH